MIELLKINCPSFVGEGEIRFLEYLIHKYKDIIYMRDTDAVYFINDKPESEALRRDISEFEKMQGGCV